MTDLQDLSIKEVMPSSEADYVALNLIMASTLCHELYEK